MISIVLFSVSLISGAKNLLNRFQFVPNPDPHLLTIAKKMKEAAECKNCSLSISRSSRKARVMDEKKTTQLPRLT